MKTPNPLFYKKDKIHKVSDDQTNIDKYRLAANITEYHIISKLILVKEKNYSNRPINNEIRKLDFCDPESHLRESTI